MKRILLKMPTELIRASARPATPNSNVRNVNIVADRADRGARHAPTGRPGDAGAFARLADASVCS